MIAAHARQASPQAKPPQPVATPKPATVSPGPLWSSLALTVDEEDSPLEREADAVASQVLSRPAGTAPPPDSTAPHGVQRKCAECEREEEEEEEIHRKGEPGLAGSMPLDTRSVTSFLASDAGRPLDADALDYFEPRFGRDFGAVRIHTGARASESARSVRALAYTTGPHVVFREGAFSPATNSGRHLIAHELAHTVQQRSAPPRISRQQAAPAVDAASIKAAVDKIMNALSGPTFAWNSTAIVKEFQVKDTAYIRALMTELKARAAEYKTTAEGMVKWLFDDIDAEDKRTLRGILIQKNVLEDLAPILVDELVANLGGWLDYSAEIMAILTQMAGASLDDMLGRLRIATKKDEASMAEYLFGQIDAVSARKLREHCFTYGGPVAGKYAAYFTAARIHTILRGGWLSANISHSESTQVLENVLDTPIELRVIVQYRLDQLTTASMKQSAENVLMAKLDPEDYMQLQRMPGMTLRQFDREVTTLEKVASAAKWIDMVAAWIGCGMLGVVTGILAAVWDIVKGVWGIVKAAWHILWTVAYFVSLGTVGSENYLAVKDFCIGMAKTIRHPGEAFDQMWGELKDEFKTIEGPYTDCKRAEFIVRKIVGVLVNIILIFVAGYGLVKAGISAVLEFAELAQKIGVIEALVQTAARAGRAILKFIPANATKLAEFVASMLRPGRLLLKLKNQLRAIFIAVEDEGVWGYMRGRGGKLLESEKNHWKDNKDRWRALGNQSAEKEAALEDKFGQMNDGLKQEQVPADSEGTAKKFDEDASKLNDDVDKLDRDVKGEPEPGATAAGAAEELPKDYLEWEKRLSRETREMLEADPELRKVFAEMDPEVRNMLTLCDSPCIPTKPRPSAADVKRVRNLIDRLELPKDHKGLREYLHRRRDNITKAIDDIQNVADGKELQVRLNEGIAEIAKTEGINAKLRPDGRWEVVVDGKTVLEYDVTPYNESPTTGNFFNGHHGIQGEWGRERLGALYDYDAAPTIELRDTHAGTPHRTVTTRQQNRAAGLATRTYADELKLLQEDMVAANVPEAYAKKIVDQSNEFFAKIYRQLEKTDPSKLLDIFGTWKP